MTSLKILSLPIAFVGALAFAQAPEAPKVGEPAKVEAPAAPVVAKKMSKKAARKECLKENPKAKGSELKACVDERSFPSKIF